MTQPNHQPPPQLKTQWGQRLKSFLDELDNLGQLMFKNAWEDLRDTLVEVSVLAINLIFLRVSSLFMEWYFHEDFSSFNVCQKKSPMSPEFYACYYSVLSDIIFWVVLLGKLLGQVLQKLKVLKKLGEP
jgi:hypothetical protein